LTGSQARATISKEVEIEWKQKKKSKIAGQLFHFTRAVKCSHKKRMIKKLDTFFFTPPASEKGPLSLPFEALC